MGSRRLGLITASLALAAFLMLALPPVVAQVQTDYPVQAEPDPLIDNSSRIGESAGGISASQLQDSIYENLIEENTSSASDQLTNSPAAAPSGSWNSPQDAYSSNNAYAYTSTHNATQTYGGYGFAFPSESIITKVEVGYEAWTAVNEKISITCSWDAGDTWAAENTSNVLPTSDPNSIAWMDFTSVTAWTPQKLSNDNFRVRVKAVKEGTMSTVYLDWLPVRVTYTYPTGYRLRWEHRITGIGTHDNYYLRVYGYATGEENFSISVWNGSEWADTGRKIQSGAPAWVEYRIPGEWVIGGSVSVKYEDQEGNNSRSILSIDYAGIRGITGGFDFSLTPDSSIACLTPGSENSCTIAVSLVHAPAENVTLSGAWIGGTPSGVSTSIVPFSGTPPFNSTLTLTAAEGANQGNYIYRITGSSTGLTRHCDLTVVVGSPPFDFAVSAVPSSINIWQGDTGTTTVSITLESGTPKPVALSGSWVGSSPSGISAGLSINSGTPPYESVLSFVAAPDAAVGTFTYRLTAIWENLVRTKDISLTVNALTLSFSITASPQSLTLVRDDSATASVSVSLLAGRSDSISLTGSWVGTTPTGVTAQLSLSSGLPPFTGTLTFYTTKSVTAGVYTYRVTGRYGDFVRSADIVINVNPELAVTVSTEKGSYEKGETVEISGTVKNAKGNPVENGTAIIRLTCGSWSRDYTAAVLGGGYSKSVQISFGYPEGSWNISVTAADSSGNSGSVNGSISVATPEQYAYYTVQFMNPVAGMKHGRGETVRIAVKVTEGAANVEEAEVSLITPSGKTIRLTETSPGTYAGEWTPSWDEPIGTVSISAEGTKAFDNAFKAGGAYINLLLEPATLQINLISPADRRLEVGSTATIIVEVRYPDGTPLQEALITATTPSGENLVLAHENGGLYRGTYHPGEDDVGNWILTVTATDLYGNYGSLPTVIYVSPKSVANLLLTYWWAVAAAIGVAGVLGGIVAVRTMRAGRIRRIRLEKRETLRQIREAETKYYKEGTVTREVFDETIRRHEARLQELEKEERLLRKRGAGKRRR